MVETSYQISDVLAQLTAIFLFLLLFLYPITKFVYTKLTKYEKYKSNYGMTSPPLKTGTGDVDRKVFGITGTSDVDRKIIFGIFVIAALVTCFRLA